MERTENIVPLFAVTNCSKPLLSNGCSIFAYLAVVAQQRLYIPQYRYTIANVVHEL
jgi:hypothetical protein